MSVKPHILVTITVVMLLVVSAVVVEKDSSYRLMAVHAQVCYTYMVFNFLLQTTVPSDINECLLAYPCPSGQLCLDNEGSFICVCPDGLMMNSEGSCIAKGTYIYGFVFYIY